MTDSDLPLAGSFDELEKQNMTEVCVAVGVFDGVHIGHRKLLRELCAMASETGSHPVAVTFLPHPRQVLDPAHAPVLLLPPEEKYRRLTALGAEAVVVIPFDSVFAALDPSDFITQYLHSENVRLNGLCVGSKWRFGAGGKGDTALLAKIAERDGFRFHAVPEEVVDSETVSSTSIRRAAAAGNLKKAERFLGNDYELFGEVVHGHGVAGTKLVCPTANINVRFGVLPPNGVYAARMRVKGMTGDFPAIVNIGCAPTFDSYGQKDLLRVEAHLLAPCGDLYDREVVLHPVEYLRPERKFASPELLKEQIAKDITRATALLENGKEEKK